MYIALMYRAIRQVDPSMPFRFFAGGADLISPPEPARSPGFRSDPHDGGEINSPVPRRVAAMATAAVALAVAIRRHGKNAG